MARKALCALLAFAVAGICQAQPGVVKKSSDLAALNILTGSEPLSNAFKELNDNKDKAKRLITEALPLTKEKDQLRYNAALLLALVSAEQKDIPACEAFFRVCIDQAIKLHSVSKLAQSFGGLTETLYENKKFDEMNKLCQEIANLKIDDGKDRVVKFAYTERGETEFLDDDSFKTTESILPYVFHQQVLALVKLGKYDLAHKIVDNLIKSRDNFSDRQLKANLYREAGDMEKAADSYLELIERIRSDKNLRVKERAAMIDRCRYMLSSIYVDLKQINKSAEMLQELLKTNPNNAGYNNDLGYIWADHDMNLDEAETLIRKALDLDRENRKKDPDAEDKDNGAYLDSLGWVLYKKKNLKEAKKVLLEALEDKSAQHIEIYDHLGDVLMALGERDGALDAWRKGLEHVTESRRDQERKKLVEEKVKKNANP
jgi:tetratricopeptide (TPR) repeat protein